MKNWLFNDVTVTLIGNSDAYLQLELWLKPAWLELILLDAKYKSEMQQTFMSFGQEMEGSMVLLVLLFLAIPNLDAFSLKKRHYPLFQPNPFLGYRSFAEKNVFRQPETIEVRIRQPILRPLSYQDFVEKNEDGGLQNKAKNPESIGVEIKEPILRLFNYQDFAGRNRNLGLQNKAKKPRVEISEPIVRPLNKQDFDRQLEKDVGMLTKAKNPGLMGVEIREPIVRPFSYQDFAEKNEDLKERISFIISRFLEDMGLQNIPKNPGSNGKPIVQPVRFEEPLIISHGNYIFFKC